MSFINKCWLKAEKLLQTTLVSKNVNIDKLKSLKLQKLPYFPIFTKKSLNTTTLKTTTPVKKNQHLGLSTTGFGFYNHTLTQLLYKFINTFTLYMKLLYEGCLLNLNQMSGEGLFYLRGILIATFIDACLTDDEPLWEPVEWSLVQTWIMIIFFFAWIAENLISSRYGSYTGRDKRIWFSWYKTFWLVDLIYIVSYGAACLFVIVPFYHEITYSLPYVVSWWNWYSRVFFFKFISLYTIAIATALYLQINVRSLNWERVFLLSLVVTFILSYLLYTHFIISFFSYFTDPIWYRKNRLVDYVQLSHEPLKWGYGPAKRDHYSYHKTSTVFWFKNDGPYAAAFLMIHLFLFFSLFSMYLYWVTLVRRIYSTQEVSYTFVTYCVSALKQFLYFFLLFYLLILVSYFTAYWRYPMEFWWTLNTISWWSHFLTVASDYSYFILSLL